MNEENPLEEVFDDSGLSSYETTSHDANLSIEDDQSGPKSWPGMGVLFGGLATTSATLLGVSYLSMNHDTYIMGWYANYIIPAGAILVGLCAGSGYGIASWLSGVKMGGAVIVTVLMLQVASYFTADYVEYRKRIHGMPPALVPSYTQYFDLVTRQFAWDDKGKPGQPFGIWGYGMRALEVAGFALGGVIAPAILMSLPYCSRCQVYMKDKEIGWLPAGIKPRKVKKKDTEGLEEYAREQQQALDEGQALTNQMMECAANANSDDFSRLLGEHQSNKKEIQKQTSRVMLKLQHCPKCGSGDLIASVITGFGEEAQTVEVARQGVTHEFVDRLA